MTQVRNKKSDGASVSHALAPVAPADYGRLVFGISALLERARRSAARAVNSALTAAYWEIGRRIVEHEQGGKARAEYGETLLRRLAHDLTARHGRGFSKRNLDYMRAFYLGWEIVQTPSAQFEARAKPHLGGREEPAQKPPTGPAVSMIPPAPSAELPAHSMATFPLSWSHYVRLLSVEKPQARAFYEKEGRLHG